MKLHNNNVLNVSFSNFFSYIVYVANYFVHSYTVQQITS